ncbi:MAG TPA: aldehyde dehydrogenase family protein, partial [Prolixibacteraceae bacterium]|nr:aldehyde dehydrogenase family protein [Prolixibacteraceae bacterium]
AIDAALKAREQWAALSWQHRASIFLKAADLIAGPYRAKINAATLLGQSKNAFQAEIDAACELADFYRFGVKCMTEIYSMQPDSAPGIWNYNEYRPLEGFVFALTPFNFTSIAGNLPAAPALMGNVCVWKPSKTAIYSAAVIMEVFREAGVPDGVINLVFASGPVAADTILSHPDFAGIHFTGSTGVFHSIWKTIGENIGRYRSSPYCRRNRGQGFHFCRPHLQHTGPGYSLCPRRI